MEEKRTLEKKYGVAILVYIALILALLFAANTEAINGWLLSVLKIFRPVINGLIIAYLCNPIFRFFERCVFAFVHSIKIRRILSLLLAFLTMAALIALFLLLLLPQLISSFSDLANNFNSYASVAIEEANVQITHLNGLVERITGEASFFGLFDESSLRDTVSAFLGEDADTVMDYIIQNIDFDGIVTTVSDFFAIITDFIFGIFVSIYLLSSKEKRSAQLRKFRHALLGEKFNAYLLRFVSITNDSLGKYLRGKALASALLGILYYIILSVHKAPYAILIATIMSVMNMIPLFGPIIGFLLSAFIMLLASPSKVIPFLLLTLILQQLDMNILSPKILGTNLGISPLCVMIAISIMGSLWGLTGMILGVPIFAAILEFTEQAVMERLQAKGLPSRLGNYYAPDSMMAPAQQVYNSSTRLMRAYEKRMIRLRKKIRLEGEENLTRKERSLQRVHRILNKIGLKLPESPEAYVQFVAEEIAAEAAKQSNADYRDLHKTDCTDTAENASGSTNA